jgi:hypothetical protein
MTKVTVARITSTSKPVVRSHGTSLDGPLAHDLEIPLLG